MSLLRAFIAIEIPEEIKKEIAVQTGELRQVVGRSVRWSATGHIHLTLKFLGEISSSNIDFLTQALKTEAGQHAPFEMTVGGLGAFPNPRRARVIWIGLEAPAALGRLQHHIEAVTARLGYPAEGKPFSAHLTIGRVREQISSVEAQSLRNALENTEIGVLGTFAAKFVSLFRSDLQPGGPVHACLFTAALGG
jgi:RNA 2',3'-cyclic 3'-phosphodiesterase